MSDLLLAYHDPAMRIFEIHQFTRTTTDSAGRAVHYVARQPNWVIRAALAAFALVLALPIFLLFLLAMIAAAMVFGVLILANSVVGAMRGVFGSGRDGRSANIRVVQRDHERL